jgi:D-alanyl-D-alanine carboxypeptidase
MDLTKPLEAATRLIDQWLTYRVYADRLPGLSLGIVYEDRVILRKGYGYANREEKIATSETTCYRIASISKIFTALAILQLFEQGKLRLDDPVQHHLPWCSSEQAQETARITIRQLLTHTAGLDRDGDTPHWFDYHFPSLPQIQKHIAEGALTYRPTEAWKYSNLGYTLLGAVIEAASGQSYEDYVTEQIVQRLDLTLTAPELTSEVIAQLAPGYTRDLPERVREPFPQIRTNVMASATGFASNVRDFCTFMMAQFDGDTRLLKDETKREMRRVQWVRDGFTGDWGLGYETWKINQRRVYGHGGSFQGYKSRFAFDPENKIGLVIFVNAMEGPAQSLVDGAWQVIDYVISHFAELEQALFPLENGEKYEGVYRTIWGDTTIAAVSKSLLFYQSNAQNPFADFGKLRYEQDDQFTIISGNPVGSVGETTRFVFDGQGMAQKMIVGPNPADRFEPGDYIL